MTVRELVCIGEGWQYQPASQPNISIRIRTKDPNRLKKKERIEKKKKGKRKHHNSRFQGLNENGIGHKEGIKWIKDTERTTHQGEGVRAALR